MFLGHYAVALAAKKAAPDVRLGTLVLAAQWSDLLWPLFLFAGVERVAIEPHATRVTPLNFLSYPFTHSLLMAALWGLLFWTIFFLAHRSLSGNSVLPGFVLGVCVLSHWVLDYVTHRPDLPLWPGLSPHVGLGLWNHPAASLVLEYLLFALGLWIYWSVARRVLRPAMFWPLIALLVGIGTASYFGKVPPSVRPVMIAALSQWLIVAWAYAAERPSWMHHDGTPKHY